ncbi:hypothetical protein AB0C77_12830 [Streptomyces sp. NPDC048629]|uniref:hypothetical protein n=1 Tax=Streptomyces sp. NPDC048629 TaxID=3154824 RepID=UPI00342C1B97
MERHQLATARTAGFFATGAGLSCGLLLWGIAATEFMGPVALYEGLALGSIGVAAAGAVTLGSALTATHRADIQNREGR